MSEKVKDYITSDDILGKKAVDSHGDILGVVIKLHIDNKSKKMLGITIDQGFMKPDIFIGLEYVKYFGIDAVLLNEYPIEKVKGMKVLNSKGRELGVVVDIVSEDNKLKEIIFSRRFSKPIRVSISDINLIGMSVILQDNYKKIDPENESKE